MTEDWLKDLRRGDKELTKRRVLAFVMSQYDPLGLMAPLLIMAKLMLRPLYGPDYPGGWDDPLPQDQALRWQSFMTVALKTGELRVPRAVVREGDVDLMLEAFWDPILWICIVISIHTRQSVRFTLITPHLSSFIINA